LLLNITEKEKEKRFLAIDFENEKNTIFISGDIKKYNKNV
jgi:hypothetical protein